MLLELFMEEIKLVVVEKFKLEKLGIFPITFLAV